MLVLSRKKNERIHIDGGIVLHVLEIRGDKVRIGIDAPRHLMIARGEIADDMIADNAADVVDVIDEASTLVAMV